MQNIYLRKDFHPLYMKNSYNTMRQKKNTKVGKIFAVMLYKTRLKNGQCIDKKYSTSGKCKLGPKWDSYTFIF